MLGCTSYQDGGRCFEWKRRVGGIKAAALPPETRVRQAFFTHAVVALSANPSFRVLDEKGQLTAFVCLKKGKKEPRKHPW